MLIQIQDPSEEWQRALREKLNDKIRWDPVTLQLYSTAACIYDITPLAVMIPETVDDIVQTVNICQIYGIPVLPRGAGSSLAGNSVGRAVILDLTHHFQIIDILSDSQARVGVGVVLKRLQDALKEKERKFGPDPSSGNICVIGGMLGNNSGGPHTILHGSMYKHVNEVSVILANGRLFRAKNIAITDITGLDDFHRPYYEKIHELFKIYANRIEKSRPRVTKSASGYQVWDILTTERLNMASLFVGSEGTLGVFIEALLNIIPLKPERGIISLYFSELEDMGKAVQILRRLGASAIEFVDQSFMSLALEYQPDLRKFLPDGIRYLLFVEFEGVTVESIHDSFQMAIDEIVNQEKLGQEGAYSTDESEIEKIFTLRKAATIILNKIEGKNKPIPFVEDTAIHPDVFPDFLREAGSLLKKFDFKYVIYGHAGDGNLHLRPLIDLKDEKTMVRIEEFMDEFVDLVIQYNGSLTGEHGDGRLRTPFIPKRFPELMPLFKEIKALFDPTGIMNPDIIVPRESIKWNADWRYSPSYEYINTDSRLDDEKWRSEIEKCHGCGTCREYCPVFVATGEEEATARAKANILRGIISGKTAMSNIDSDHFFTIMDYCLNCGQCLTDCPTSVDIPGMAVVAKEKLHQKRPFKINEIILQNGKIVSRIAALTAPFSNWMMRLSLIRTAVEKIAGIDKRRDFPLFSRFSIRATKNGVYPSGNGKNVVLWSGCSAQYSDPEGEHQQSVQLLQKLGYKVIIPSWRCCNIAKISYGNISGARSDIDFNIRILLPLAKKKIPIIFTSASCGYAFIKEYDNYLPDDEDLQTIATESVDIHDFLMKAYHKGEFKGKFSSLDSNIVYHEPCHLKSQQNDYGPIELLKLIPSLNLIDVEDSCCGIAGTYGMKKENYEISMKMGQPLFSQINEIKPDTLVSGCGTCQIQLTKGTGIDTIHPIVLLNQSYQQEG
jgi:anaerobic glycerol-3-phosphate dehydrogenase C subunit